MKNISEFPTVANGAINGVYIQTVNARDLHGYLCVESRFNDWIKNRIDDFGFIERIDFTTHTENLVSGGKRKEYAISIDMAKELSMVERNEQGKRARQYFIECERRAKDPAVALNDPAMLRHLLLENVEKVLHLEADVREMAPVVTAYEHLTRSDGTMCISDAAKALGMRQKDLFSWMQAERWIYRRTGNAHWVGYQQKIQSGHLDHRVEEVTRADGSSKITEQVRVTAKGLAALAKVLAPTSAVAA